MDAQKNAEIIARIKYLMKEMGVRQVQFAERIDVDTSNLSKYLNAHMPLARQTFRPLTAFLSITWMPRQGHHQAGMTCLPTRTSSVG